MNNNFVTVIVPVYADWSSLKICIKSLIDTIGKSQHQIMLVNDCGPEADKLETEIKNTISEHKNFHYHRNPTNLGFVGTCNRAVLELDKTNNDILLLNSDTKVTAGFLQEMIKVLYATSKIGAVSPRSNNATLATVPLWSAHQKGIDLEESYKIFLKIKDKLPQYVEVPVAHGFCMLIRREVVKKYGLFDTAFGKGYGEEVDFCQRIKKHGFNSELCNRAFVFHLEAKSFTLEAKAKLIEENNKIIWQRYPEYRKSVRDYMQKAIAEEKSIEKSVGLMPPKSGKVRKLTRKLKNLAS